MACRTIRTAINVLKLVPMENEGAQNHNNNIQDPILTIGIDDNTELIWNCQEYDMDALLGDDINASTGNDAEGSNDNHPESGASSTHKRRHTIQQIQALEALFETCSHPDDETRKELGAKIGMDSQQIRNWFQNRRSQIKVRSCSEENEQIRAQNAVLKAENTELRKKVLERTCFPCLCLTAPPELLSEKQRLLIENTRLKEEFLRTEATFKELSRGAPLPLAVPSISQGRVTLLLQHAERAMKEFQALAAAGERMWLQSGDGEVLNVGAYTAGTFPKLLGPCPEGFVTEATRETSIVQATAADLVGILTDVGRWSEMFPGIVAAVSARDVGSNGILGSRDGLIQLMNAELWVQSPRMPNRSVNFLRFTKMTANGQRWAVVDVSIDAILADGQEGGVEPLSQRTVCRLLPSGCLTEDTNNGCCKVTWIVHAEYDETAVPELLRPLLRSGQALGAPRWLATLQRLCGFKGVLKNFPAGDGRKGVMEVAQRMTPSFYAAISGLVTLPGSNVSEWRGSNGTGAESFEASVRMVIWNFAGQPAGLQALSATTTVWLPNTEPQVVLDYLRDERRRGEWDVLANGAGVEELGSIITGNRHGNAISILRSYVTNGTNNKKMVILQEACSDKSCCMVVYSLIEENVMTAITNGADPSSSFLLPSGFAILPDGHNNNAKGCLLTAVCQTLLNNPPTENLATDAFDVVGKQLCLAIEKIKAAVGAGTIVPA